MEKEFDYLQNLMDEAYLKWKKINNDWNLKDFDLSLDYKHRNAVLFGNLNYQVENGGFCSGLIMDMPKLVKNFYYSL